jgi:hypothetical protein
MAYFNHAFKKAFVATLATQAESAGFDPNGAAGENAGVDSGILISTDVHVSKLKSTAAAEGMLLGPGVTGFFNEKTDKSILLGKNDCCSFYIASASIKLDDKQGPFHGGYQESNKSKVINPKFLRKVWKVDANDASPAFLQIGGTPDNIDGDGGCLKEYLCGESYYLRVEAKGTSALRFANHNLYQTLQADGGCCDDPSSPTPVAENGLDIYKQWGTAIATNPYLADFINPILVVDGDSYAYSEELAAVAGLAVGQVYSAVTTSADNAGLILQGAYVDTKFGDCTFQCSDYYGKEPVQLFASEVDLNGDPCTFGGVCVVETCPGIQANGLGEQKVRELILSESYLQNFMSSDLRIREITQGTRAYEVLSRTASYSSFFMLHSVPRYSNPSGTYDNDQYLLEIIGSEDTTTFLEEAITTLNETCNATCDIIEDYTAVEICDFVLPVIPIL